MHASQNKVSKLQNLGVLHFTLLCVNYHHSTCSEASFVNKQKIAEI